MPEELYRSNLRRIEDAQKTGATELSLEYIEQKDLLKIVVELKRKEFSRKKGKKFGFSLKKRNFCRFNF